MATDTEKLNTLYASLRAYLNNKRPPEKLFIVHRLDREASGLLVFAKTLEAKERLQDQFKDHSAGRRYVAVVEGQVKADDFTIRSYLAENAAYKVYSTPNRRVGKLAVTHVHVIKRNAKTTLVEVRLETGRKHQIRVHLAERDTRSSATRTMAAEAIDSRLALHGAHLGSNTRKGTLLKFDSRYPKPFNTL
jgi:23S rRNA pseudouridine1911/1915/1917 synthase